jgi:hypothetical protein
MIPQSQIRGTIAGAALVLAAISQAVALEPTITDWMFRTGGATGNSSDSQVNAAISGYAADVLGVYYTGTNVYIQAESIPSHPIGPWTGRNEYPTAQGNCWQLLRTPSNTAGPGDPLPLGAIGVFVNGVQLFSWSDATSYEDEDVWHNVAPVVRTDIDSAKGHPSPPSGGGPPRAAAEGHTHSWTKDPNHTHGANAKSVRVLTAAGAYHYHTQPPLLRAQLGDTGAEHSPILGWAFDGNPIYGPYAYSNTNGTGGVRRMVSSYALRSISVRTALPDGTVLAVNLQGPPVNATYPLGTFAEDYIYTGGSGDLDQYNGRTCVTPEYPGGVYAYFTTIDGSGNSAFPYSVGPDEYRGAPIMANMGPSGGHATIPGGATQYIPTSSVLDWDVF